jgi:UDP-N-acetylmuramoylalanine--D-glutamate ligase
VTVQPLMPSRVLIVGLASSGLAAARLAAADGAAVAVNDRRPATELTEMIEALPPSATAVYGEHPSSCLDDTDLVVVSPGVPADLHLLGVASSRGIPVLSEVEFAWRHAPDVPLAAVTGSNGKSTVTTLIAEMLNASGIAAVAGGNLGPPASDLVLAGGWQMWVLEISSFQSEIFRDFRPRVGVFLNLSQDHLERHPDMASYAAAKGRLFANQVADDVAVFNANDPLVLETPTAGERLLFSVDGAADAFLDGSTLVLGDETLLDRRDMALTGLHNVSNALAAGLAARALGAEMEAIRSTLRAFSGLPHRHRVVHEQAGVRWIDDSKATNVGATLAALRGYPDGTVHLILGGLGKGQDFSPLAAEAARAAARIYVIGDDGPLIGRSLGHAHVEQCGTLAVAVERARKTAAPGQVVLLAPACASFDQYDGYPARGRHFCELVVGGGETACR